MGELVYIGLLGVIIVLLSQSIALPLVKSYDVPAGMMLFLRGAVSLLSAVIMAIILRTSIAPQNYWATFGVSLTFAFAATCLYKAIKAWDVALVITLIAATPVVNFLFTALVWKQGVSPTARGCFLFVILGIVMTLSPWKKTEQRKKSNWKSGFIWAIGGVVLNGLYYEALNISKLATTDSIGIVMQLKHSLPLVFWQSATVAIFGFAIGFWEKKQPFNKPQNLQKRRSLPTGKLVVWAFLAGFCYFIGNVLAFQGLPRETASVLLQLETPAVIAASFVLVPQARREQLSPVQWMGISICLLAGAILSLTPTLGF